MKRKYTLLMAVALTAMLVAITPAQALCAGATASPASTQSSVAGQMSAPLLAVTTTASTTDLNKLVASFMVKADKYYSDYNYSNNRYKYTAKELRMLATVIFLEARGEPYNSKVAIGNVVMNRVLAPGYPGDTIASVVTRPNQFCYNAATVPNAECIKVAHDVLDYETWTVPQNTYFFRATASKANWGSHTFYARIGATAFYRASYAGRYNGSTVPQKLFQRVYKWPQYGCVVAKRVKKVQVMLNTLGFKTAADGYFGTGTRTALVNFQKKYGLVADGIAGPSTLKKLITKYGISKYLKL